MELIDDYPLNSGKRRLRLTSAPKIYESRTALNVQIDICTCDICGTGKSVMWDSTAVRFSISHDEVLVCLTLRVSVSPCVLFVELRICVSHP
jgi:hypothetical protein